MFSRKKNTESPVLSIAALISELKNRIADNRVNIECLDNKVDVIPSILSDIQGNFDQIEEKHNNFVEKVTDDLAELSKEVKYLESRIKFLNKFDDVNREKFDALCEHFNIFFRHKPETCVVMTIDDDEADEDITV